MLTFDHGGGDSDVDVGLWESPLDVPGRAARLLTLLQRRNIERVTKRAAHAIAAEHGDGLNASRRTVNDWINALRDEGVLKQDGTDEHGAATLEVPHRPR